MRAFTRHRYRQPFELLTIDEEPLRNIQTDNDRNLIHRTIDSLPSTPQGELPTTQPAKETPSLSMNHVTDERPVP